MATGDFLDFGVAGPWSGGGFWEKFGKTMQNDTLLQYLSGVGAGIANKGIAGGTAAANDITMNTIATKKYAKLLERIMSGGMPGVDAKLSDKGLTINMARETPVGEPGPNPGQTGVAPLQMDAPQPSRLETQPSPFASGLPSMSASDLAGLNPELINQALQFKMYRDKMIADVGEDQFNRTYKQKLMEQVDAQIAEGKSLAAHREVSDAIAAYKALQPDLPPDALMYDYDKQEHGFKGSYKEWKEKESNDPAEMRIVERAMKDPKFAKAIKELRASGASTSNVNISPFDRTRQTGTAESINDVLAPDYIDKTKKGLGDNPSFYKPELVDALVKQGKSEEEAQGLINNALLKDRIESGLKQAYQNVGKTVTRGKDGWYVDGKIVREYPNGY